MTAHLRQFFWPVVGLSAVAFSGWLLVTELRTLSLAEVAYSIETIPPHRWLLVVAATMLAYGALAEYDRIALGHLGREISWRFVLLCSFTTYALSHNIGASVLSGAVVRYRAYSSKGLSAGEVSILVALCSFTFALGTITLGGAILVWQPETMLRFFDMPESAAFGLGLLLLAIPAFYVLGSLLHFRSLTIGTFHLYYPRPKIVVRQFIVAPLELIGAAAIIYFSLPIDGNPGFVVILAVFLASFSAALISHAPGGLGVIEVIFISVLKDIDPADVMAALIIFRLFFLLIPLAVSLAVVLLFERNQMAQRAPRTNG